GQRSLAQRADRDSGSYEQEVPEDVDSGMDEGRSEDGIGFAPGPTVEESGNGSQQDVAPIGKMQVCDVREAEEDRGGDPADGVAVGGARKKILQQAAEEKFFREGGKEKNSDGKWDEGFPLVNVRGVGDEVEFD